MYIRRALEKDVIEGAKFFPGVAILGPRQSGKTTMAKHVFPKHAYVSLEPEDIREFAQVDPRGFIEEYRNKHGLIIDEFQQAPSLPTYLQTIMDEEKKLGFFVLTGSQNFLVNKAITQSLPGRVSLHTLLPLSADELSASDLLPDSFDTVIVKGMFPAIYTKKTPARRLYGQYLRTYLEKDLHQLSNVGDLSNFRRFLELCAGLVGQTLNLTELGNDAGVSDQTAERWLSVLEASYIVFRLQPYEKSFGKRLVKRSKLYFYDTGLVCHLLKKQKLSATDPFRGPLFECFVMSEIVKNYYNRGHQPDVFFWRDQYGHEVDCIAKYGDYIAGIEIKASKTFSRSFASDLIYWKEQAREEDPQLYVVYGESKKHRSGPKNLISWQSVGKILDFLPGAHE